MRIEYFIDVFDKENESLIKEILLRDITEAELNNILGYCEDHELIGGYNIESRHVEKLKKYLTDTESIDLDKYDYFVGIFSVPDDWSEPTNT